MDRTVQRPLGAIEVELACLQQRLQAGQAGQCNEVRSQAWRLTLQQAQVHLRLSASRLLPVWRGLCTDRSVVDHAERRLLQLQAQTEAALAAGGRAPAATALVQGLQQHLLRTAVLLRALQAVVDRDSLQALASTWAGERARLHRAQRLALALDMDNEDADPVGQPPR